MGISVVRGVSAVRMHDRVPPIPMAGYSLSKDDYLGVGLLDEHIRHCVRNAVQEGDAAGDAKIEEAVTAIERLLRS